jgi:cytochrome c-type biogenesis protein CcmH/NrfG
MLAACALVVLAVTQAIKPRPPGGFVTGGVAAPGEESGPVDLSKVTNEQMEEVVAQNPGVVRMRLALARRYIEAQEWERARDHAHVAIQQEPGDANRQEALWVLGWSTVMLGEPETGASLLQQSLDLDPDDPNALFFLGVTKLELLGDPAGAVPLLEKLLVRGEGQMTAAEQRLVEQALARARQEAGGS